MAVKTIDVWQCDNDKCGKVHPYGALPDGWVWGMVTFKVKKADPMRRSEVVEVDKREERVFCGDACVKVYSKDTGHTLERPKVPDATA